MTAGIDIRYVVKASMMDVPKKYIITSSCVSLVSALDITETGLSSGNEGFAG